MQSKFRLFVGSVLLLALPAFGQASEPTPAATTAAPIVEMEASGAAEVGVDATMQHGDGVYALRLLPPNGVWTLVGFVRVKNGGPACKSQPECDQGDWVLSKTVMQALKNSTNSKQAAPWWEGKLPLPAWSVKMDRITTADPSATLATIATAFIALDGKSLAKDAFTATQVVSVRTLRTDCTGTNFETLYCP
jgi:hypothetical protein